MLLSSINSFQDENFRYTFTIIYSSVTILKNILLCISVLIKEKREDNPQTGFLDVDLDSFNPINKQY